jgi:hypothetical protein
MCVFKNNCILITIVSIYVILGYCNKRFNGNTNSSNYFFYLTQLHLNAIKIY